MSEWRICEKYPKFEVSDGGQVRHIDTHGLCATGLVRSSGYQKAYLHWKTAEGWQLATPDIHRLVAKAFCYQGEGATMVDHIDHNRQNNRADNLRWITPSANARSKRRGRADSYRVIYANGTWVDFKTQAQVAKFLQTTEQRVSLAVNRRIPDYTIKGCQIQPVWKLKAFFQTSLFASYTEKERVKIHD